MYDSHQARDPADDKHCDAVTPHRVLQLNLPGARALAIYHLAQRGVDGLPLLLEVEDQVEPLEEVCHHVPQTHADVEEEDLQSDKGCKDLREGFILKSRKDFSLKCQNIFRF